MFPGLILYGGSIAPGRWQGKDVTIQDVFEAVGAFDCGKLGAEEFAALENAACPGAGACGGQFTANTMATACEFLGLSPFGSAAVPAMDAGKDDVSRQAGALVVDLLGAEPPAAADSDAVPRSRTPSPRSPRRAARPTPSCISWRLPKRPAFR